MIWLRQTLKKILSNHSELPPLPPTTTPKPGVSTTTARTTTTTTTHAPGPGFCNGKPDGMYANPDDKTSFYMCAGGITHVRYCGSGTVFDDKCKCCTWPWALCNNMYYNWCKCQLLKSANKILTTIWCVCNSVLRIKLLFYNLFCFDIFSC